MGVLVSMDSVSDERKICPPAFTVRSIDGFEVSHLLCSRL